MKLETKVNSKQEIFILFDIVSRLLPLLLLESEALFPENTTFVALETNGRPIQSPGIQGSLPRKLSKMYVFKKNP